MQLLGGVKAIHKAPGDLCISTLDRMPKTDGKLILVAMLSTFRELGFPRPENSWIHWPYSVKRRLWVGFNQSSPLNFPPFLLLIPAFVSFLHADAMSTLFLVVQEDPALCFHQLKSYLNRYNQLLPSRDIVLKVGHSPQGLVNLCCQF